MAWISHWLLTLLLSLVLFLGPYSRKWILFSHCWSSLDSSDFLMNILFPFYRGLESSPCTLAPWGLISGLLWLLDPAMFISPPPPHLFPKPSTSPPPCFCYHIFWIFILSTCLDFYLPVSVCLDLPFRFIDPLIGQPTFFWLILSPTTNKSIILFIMHLLYASTLNPSFSSAAFILFPALGAVRLLAEEFRI